MSDKLVWIDAHRAPGEEAKEKVTAALESGADAVLVSPENVDRVRELGKITVSFSGWQSGHPDDRYRLRRRRYGLPASGAGLIRGPRDGEKAEGQGARACRFRPAGRQGIRAARRKAGQGLRLPDHRGKGLESDPTGEPDRGIGGAGVKIIAKARDIDEASVALQTLEKGADGVLIEVDDPIKIREITRAIIDKAGRRCA